MTTPTTQREADERAPGIDLDRLQVLADILYKRDSFAISAELNEMIHHARQAAPEAPAGYKLVPLDPPLAMAKAFRDADINGDRFLDGYAAMLRAATDQPSAGQVGSVLPCPFCGSTDDVYFGKVSYCDNCGADGPCNERDGKPVATWNDRAPLTPTAPQAAEEQLRRMRAAFHVNMLRAFPGNTHAEIEAEIDKACGAAPQAASQQAGANIVIDWPACNPGCDYEAPDGSFRDCRNQHCSCDAAKASIARQLAPQAATTAACQPSTLTGQPDAAICQPAATTASASGDAPITTADEFFAEARRLGCKLPDDVRAALARAPLPARDLALTNDGREPDWDAYAAAEQEQAVDVARDAARYRVLRLHVMPGDVRLAMTQLPPKAQTPPDRIDLLCDIEISRTNTTGGSDAE